MSRPKADEPRQIDGKRQRGVALVELALATPIMLIIMLGTIDLGRMFFDYVELRNAVVEGAIYGSRNPSDTGGMTSRVTGHGVPTGTSVVPSVDSGCHTKGATGKVTVTATSTFTPITTGFFQTYLGFGSVTLSASSSMRCMT